MALAAVAAAASGAVALDDEGVVFFVKATCRKLFCASLRLSPSHFAWRFCVVCNLFWPRRKVHLLATTCDLQLATGNLQAGVFNNRCYGLSPDETVLTEMLPRRTFCPFQLTTTDSILSSMTMSSVPFPFFALALAFIHCIYLN